MPSKEWTRWVFLPLALSCVLIQPIRAADGSDSSTPPKKAEPPFFPQLEVAVPFEPTALKSGGAQILVYELALRNFEFQAVDLQSVSVFDASGKSAGPIAVFDSKQLATMISSVGFRPADA